MTAHWVRLLAATALLGATAAQAETIKLVEHPKDEVTSHVGKKADNPGDILSFANTVFDAADKAKAGTDQGYCIRIVPGKSFECIWTLTLPDGQITVEGPFFDTADSVLAVTGGTGKYADVRGEMALHAHDDKYDFVYTLRHAGGS